MKTVTIGFNNESQKALNDALALMKLRMKPTHAVEELVMAKFEEVVSGLGRIDFNAETKPGATIPKSPTPRTDAAKDFSNPEKMYEESRKIEMELNAKRRIITPNDLLTMNDVLLALHHYYELVVHLGGSSKLEKNIRGKMVNRDSIVNFADFVRDAESKPSSETILLGMEAPPKSLTDCCTEMRTEIKVIEIKARHMAKNVPSSQPQSFDGQHGEMIAQTMLAVRHLEDARLRLGKVIQYSGDGVSIYDKA